MRILFFILLSFNVNAQLQINGTGTTVHINGTGTTITVNGIGSGYNEAQTGDITFTDADFNLSIPGYAKTNFTARSTAGYVEFITDETEITVKIGGDWSTASSSVDAQSECEVLVDGVYNQSLQLTADDVTQEKAITLPSGRKSVKLINGYTANSLSGSVTLPDAGVYIQGVITTGNIYVKTPVTPANKWLLVGNSITTGATTTHPSILGFAGLFRADGRSVQSDSWGARTVATTNGTEAATVADFLSAQLDGTANELFIFLGTNNFGLSGQSKATFKTYYGLMLDSFRAVRTNVTVYCVSPLDRTSYSTPNAGGATLEDYSDAIQELLVTRTWAKFIYGKTLVTLSNMPDGIHPNDTGHQEMHDNLLIQYNLLQE